MTKKMAPYRVGEILDHYLNRADIYPKIQEQRIISCWELAVGRAIAEVTQAVRVRNRVLQVRVTNSVWMQELQFHKGLIIQKLNESLGVFGVQELWFFIGEKETGSEGSGDARKAERRKPGRELSREEGDRIEKEVSRLRDPEIKEALSRLFSRALTSEKAREGR
jgi:hypothetical protein